MSYVHKLDTKLKQLSQSDGLVDLRVTFKTYPESIEDAAKEILDMLEAPHVTYEEGDL